MSERLSHHTRKVVRERQNYVCALCGEQHLPGSPGCISVHHIKPRSRGGSDNPGNLVGLCRGEGTCNCHDHVDRLTLEHHIRFEQIMEEGLEYWLQQYPETHTNQPRFLPQENLPLYPLAHAADD